MGGPGSGPRRPLGRKRTVESSPRLTLAQLRGTGALAPNTRAAGVCACRPLASPLADPGWSRRATVLVRCEAETGPTGGSVTLVVESATERDAATEAALVTTRGRAGRLRWWLQCGRAAGGGGCGRRVTALYLRADRFACRHCHRLTYASTQASDRRVRALLRNGLSAALLAALSSGSPAGQDFKLKVLAHQVRSLDCALGRSRRQ